MTLPPMANATAAWCAGCATYASKSSFDLGDNSHSAKGPGRQSQGVPGGFSLRFSECICGMTPGRAESLAFTSTTAWSEVPSFQVKTTTCWMDAGAETFAAAELNAHRFVRTCSCRAAARRGSRHGARGLAESGRLILEARGTCARTSRRPPTSMPGRCVRLRVFARALLHERLIDCMCCYGGQSTV
jgi:hypothetical protein